MFILQSVHSANKIRRYGTEQKTAESLIHSKLEKKRGDKNNHSSSSTGILCTLSFSFPK